MLKELDSYDWEEAFKYAEPSQVLGGELVGRETFTREDVEEIAGIEEGENDERDWIVYGRLRDGRWFSLAAGCDYTGWGCQEGGRSAVADSRAMIERLGLTPEERERLGVVLPTEPAQ